MSRALLDTDILSEIIKGKNAAVTARAAAYLIEQGRFTNDSLSTIGGSHNANGAPSQLRESVQ